ncbi:MAG: hypothetical protein P8I93_08830 [Crocinitomicaceae bacterium]|nr:hypothetical protein [Crocinitomicaceae bacterium]
MKNQFEEHFKNLLKENEQPFDSQAWEQMSAKLDVTMPVQGAEGAQNPTGNEGIQGTQITQGAKGLSSLSKLILIGTTTTAVVVGTIFTVDKLNDKDVSKKTEIVQTITPGPDTKGPDNIGPDTKGPDTKGPDTKGPDGNKEKIIVKGVYDMCLGTKQTITNSNAIDLIVKSSDGGEWKIPSNSKLIFTPKTSGIHQIGFVKNQIFEEIVEFEVSEAVTSAFEYEDLEYIKGIPTTKAYANENIQSPVWEIVGVSNPQKGKSIEANIYKKGRYKLNLKGNLYGCEINETQEIDIPEYNLLAVNAFIPESFDSKKNTFIPFALTQREVSFRMIIKDPRDGGIVYETTETSMPWDGIDRRNGQIAETGVNIPPYVWMVELINPNPGEPKVYQGTIKLINK